VPGLAQGLLVSAPPRDPWPEGGSWGYLALAAEVWDAANRAWWREIRRHRDCRTCVHVGAPHSMTRRAGACAFDPRTAGVLPRTKRWTPFLALINARSRLPESADWTWPQGPSAPVDPTDHQNYWSKAGKKARQSVGCPHWLESTP